MQKSAFIEAREQLIEYFRSQLIGPQGGPEELIKDYPHKRYLMGTLFPPAACTDESDEDDSEGSTTEALSNDFKPSSMALSFAVSPDTSLKIDVCAGKYSKGQDNQWRREPLSFSLDIKLDESGNKKHPLFNGNARLDVTVRRYLSGNIVTIAFSNQASSGERLNPEDCLFQSSIKVKTLKGCFKEYPSSDRFKLDYEQKELELTYRNRVPWAVGHGIAVDWDDIELPSELRTQAMPSHEVKGFTTELDLPDSSGLTSETLSIHRIADIENYSSKSLLSDYELLVDAYREWIDGLDGTLLEKRFSEAKNKIIKQLRNTAERMDSGISMLRANPLAMKAFRLANKAMLMQMIHSSSDYAGKSKPKNWGYNTPDYFGKEKVGKFNWRPFQLAFQLLVIESLIPDKNGNFSSSHNQVDLLWFPTGGGKTEAYLAVAAWEMIFRRLTLASQGGGTAVIKRYTLRLLTSQQFQRAGSLICALEILRDSDEETFGKEPFSLGLWVGSASAPNSFKDAYKEFARERDSDEPENPFQLQACPWCGTSIFPNSHSEDSTDYGVNCNPSSFFRFFCPSEKCEFHSKLPIQVVDEALYQQPPTLLIGTIDKFARLTWKAEAQSFFGSNKSKPPSLIIQDELHLISGPLGTIAGIYEAGFDSIMKIKGSEPKVIAATATIRSAEQQVNKLFGRSVNIFPPSGTDESDSFFSKEDKTNPGRIYLGIMPSGHTGQTAMVQTGAAMLQSPIELGLQDKILDSYWTLPIYHNSRRELGKTMTLARDDIPARIEVIAKNHSECRTVDLVEELSANVKGSRIPEVLSNLECTVQHGNPVDVLPCTNMISVGVDIGRLGMMLIGGQPKSTAEYIQASSRVGRDKKRPPGIVVTQYSPTKPRDRSHYETFKSYHQALYRFVEPTSVTPWALPAIERALHASLISIVRVTGYLQRNDSAQYFDKESSEFQKILKVFIERIRQSMFGMDPKECDVVFDYLDSLVDDWHERANRKDKPINRYEASSGHQHRPLFKAFDSEKHSEAWKTLNSMRNVDTETHLLVRGEKND
ncbi:helicase-related protein [Psychrosphaera aestuarii]|uniref:helicase-related protein n=1 Tax=Psychrosphaera aestuarii TaxID=1266052 RepID=UPI001B323E8E|nr:helicase-related protein [Psychrosphaera aestuarii]